MSTLVSSTTTTAAAAASNAATLYAVLLEKCGPAAAAAAGWAQERYLLLVDAAALRFDDGLALLDPAQAAYVRDVAAASQDVVASLARFLASLWALAGLVVVPAARRAVALFRRQPEEWQLAEVGVLLFLYALWRFRRWVRTSETLRAVAAKLGAARRAYDARVLEARRAYASALKKLAEKSRVAASALPHALYVAAVLGGRRPFPERFGGVLRSPRLASLVLVARLYGADAALRNDEPAPPVYYRTREQLRQRKPKPKLKFWAVVGACWFCRGAAHALPFAPSDFRSSKLGSVAAAGAEALGACLAEPRRSAGRARLRRARRDRGPLGAAGRPAAAAVAAERAARRRRGVVAPRANLARRDARAGHAAGDGARRPLRGLRDHVAEVASDADGWRAAAVGCFAAMTLPYFRGAQRLHARAQAKLADVARRMRD
ncbi:hypothetical protein JL721_2204 [Aureococcus anophagefferens]|nr:hypothetical protein JL721_2204 [Aureococcus anophagefferens]